MIIIYSKNRACQVQMLIESINKFFKHKSEIYVLYDYSNDFFLEGYKKLTDCYLIKQTPQTFKKQLIDVMNSRNNYDFVLPLCDDDVFIDDCNIYNIPIEDNLVGINLRYSPDVKISYHDGSIIPNPVFVYYDNDILKWNWTFYDSRYCWGYPYQAGSVIYDFDFFKKMVNELNYHLPSTLETAMNMNKFIYKKPFLKCFSKSKLKNVSINKVDYTYNNRAGLEYSYTPEYLNDMFLNGCKLDLDHIISICKEKNNCDFVEIPLKFI